MIRHEAIAQLSRDHHQALLQAMACKRADDATAAEVAATFVEFFDSEARHHFEVEEQVLIPHYVAYLGIEAAIEPVVVQVVREHVEIRSLVERLRAGETDTAFVREVGQRLDAHVRLEERQLFVKIQENLSDDQLTELARVVNAAEDQL